MSVISITGAIQNAVDYFAPEKDIVISRKHIIIEPRMTK